MRATLLVAALLAGTAARAETQPAAAATNQDCLQCHEAAKAGEPGVHKPGFDRSVHKDLDCVTCHAGYAAPGPHELPPLTDPAEAALAARLAAAKDPGGRPRVSSPRAYLACAACHSESVDSFTLSTHGIWLTQDRPAPGPSCATCHGSPHEVTSAPRRGTPEFRPYWAQLSRRCESCHDDPKLTAAAGLKPDIAAGYRDSIHGRLTATGSERAPVCTDCHAWSVRPPLAEGETRVGVLPGGHATLSGSRIPKGAVTGSAPLLAADNRVRTCAQCHAGATPSFAAVISHKPIYETGAIPRFVNTFFSYAIVLTLLFFVFHVLVDLVYELRRRFARNRHVDVALQRRTVVRFDIHQRIQHWLMLTGSILLGLTGWPLRGAGAGELDFAERVESSRKLLALFGGPHGAGVVHRVAAVILIASAVYHVLYLAFLAKRRALPRTMLPTLQDLRDFRDNLLFLLGLKKERPKFDRYSYLEKFDYWGAVWGTSLMIVSGFVLWLPVHFSHVLPTFLLATAHVAHGQEATLEILFLFVIHFYNVHLKPSIFPMNWAWLHGRTTLEYMKHEHGAEYDRKFGKDE